jgi:hypothetical protein
VGRFVRIDDQSGRKVGDVIYARGFGLSDRSKRQASPLGYDNDELALADLIDETPAIVPVLLPVGWFEAAPKIRALEPDRFGHVENLALSAQPFPDLAGQDEGDFILNIQSAAKLSQILGRSRVSRR